MKELKKITSYELFMYGMVQDMEIEYVQFDKMMEKHIIESGKTLYQYYREWNNVYLRKDAIFTALIKWFDIEKGKVIICLSGTDGELHYE